VQVALTALSAHGAAVVLAIVVLGQSELGLSTARVGLVLAAAGAGGLLASAVATRWPEPFGTLRGIAWALLLGAGFVALLALAGGFWWALAANALADAAVTAGFIATASVRQQRTPLALLGRVAAGSAVCNAAARVLGAGGVGLLLTWQGARVTLLVDAALLAVAAAAVAVGRHEPVPSPS
jgi:predicted MFS family arabinose efflux permease